jgi:hypothetical protein
LHNLNFESFTYDGTVKIALNLQEATSSISVNAKELTLNEGEVYIESSKETVKVSDISYDKKSEIAKLSLEKEIPGEGTASLTIKFSGALNHEMAGFYRSAYKNDGKDDWMYSTQFESCDARRAFPWLVNHVEFYYQKLTPHTASTSPTLRLPSTFPSSSLRTTPPFLTSLRRMLLRSMEVSRRFPSSPLPR